MQWLLLFITFIFNLLTFSACSQNKSDANFGDSLFKKIQPLYPKKTEAHKGEWLAEHAETYQSFEDYIKSKPVRPSANRNKIYVQPMGKFSVNQNEIVNLTITYLAAFYGLQVVKLEALTDTIIYKKSRINNHTGGLQLYTEHLLDKVLRPKLPDSGVVMIGLTSIDLYPDKTWNYVFGQALLTKRVGVWSMNRFGNPSLSFEAYTLCLSRTIQTASHEIGHMFGIEHCIKYECCMNGSNHLQESDKAPRWFCWECLQKICWNTGYDMKKHLEEMEKFWTKMESKNYSEFYKKNLEALKF